MILDHGTWEKQSAAKSSVVAAVGLTIFKLVVGAVTGSLGIIAEAAHSGLDLVAALMTLFAVRISDRPADRQHTYGHGKVENVSALFETLLLLITCAWIIYEAIRRLFLESVIIEVTLWSFGVMIVSVIIDISRSRVLYRAAKKYRSQALEADALHFSTDIYSSLVVILGLVCVKASEHYPSVEFLHHADAIAALMVALIVIYISIRLGKRTINALIDTAPEGMEEKIITVVKAMSGVKGCHNVRIRVMGARYFVDIHVLMDGEQTLKRAHLLTDEIEIAIRKLVPDADVTIHPEPYMEENSEKSDA